MDITRIAGSVPTRSQTVVANGFVFTVATSHEDTLSLYSQTKSALAAIDRQLAAVGVHKSRILTAIVYITDMAEKPEMNRAWDEWADRTSPPMRACIGARLEADDRVEIVVTALAQG